VLPFFAEYNLGDDQLAAALFVLVLVGLIIGIAFTPAATRRIGKIRLVVWTAIGRAVLLVAFYLIGWANLAVVMVLALTLGLLSGSFQVHLSTMIGDSVDYVELETGSRHEGVAFSLQTLLAKVISGLGAAVTGLVLSVTGFVADQPQTDGALRGIFLLMTIIPAVSSLLSIIPFRWYRLDESAHAEIVARLSRA
jgi:Na+/melibiose symporter-like transporter